MELVCSWTNNAEKEMQQLKNKMNKEEVKRMLSAINSSLFNIAMCFQENRIISLSRNCFIVYAFIFFQSSGINAWFKYTWQIMMTSWQSVSNLAKREPLDVEVKEQSQTL